jgi:hypothetical protein
MNKAVFPIIIFILMAITLSACCNCGQSSSDDNKLRGVITMFGNEPFTGIGIKTDDNTNYALICSKELNAELINSQGKYYLIQYSEKKEANGVISVVVEKAIPIIQK